MVDPHRVELETTGHVDGAVVVAAHGRVTPSVVAYLRDDLVKRLVDGAPVLLDVTDLYLDWAPAPEVFVSALAAAGGWPLARLVLFGADEHTVGRLRACRVPASVPLARTCDEAVALVDVRPASLSLGVDLAPTRRSVQRALATLRDACERWGVPDRDDVATVVTELVTNAVEHAAPPFRLRLVLDHAGLRVSVRDRSPGPPPDARGPGLRTVARLSRTWGVVQYGDGKSVWAQLPLTRSASAPETVPRDEGLRVVPGQAAATTPLRWCRFATADPEHAHAFLRTVYGEHTLRLSGMEEPLGSHLAYEGATTDRFAIERLMHGGPAEGLFPQLEELVVVQPLDGDLRVVSGRHELRAAVGDVVLCCSATLDLASTRLDVEVVRLEPAAVARVTAELTGFDAPSVPFDPGRPVSPARAAHWRATIAHLRRDVLGNDEVMASPLARATILRSLVALLVETFPNPARDVLGDPASPSGPVAPRAVRRAIAFIEEHAGDDIGLAEIAASARIGARGLQLAFRRHADVTPLEHLRRVRLGRAHRDLQAGNPAEVTVGAIADRWGFPHHGNFSAVYLRTYGRSPSITLRS